MRSGASPNCSDLRRVVEMACGCQGAASGQQWEPVRADKTVGTATTNKAQAIADAGPGGYVREKKAA
jgi:hypothetical protein